MVYNKMKSIFRSIMVEKTLWDVNNVEAEERERLAEKQLALFWFSDPRLVIIAIQFMQFGYAVAISAVIIYWEEINDGDIPMFYYPLGLMICYSIFILVTSQVIPRYTLCTSLAQLVDERRLQETLAVFRLEEAKQKALDEQAYGDLDNDDADEVIMIRDTVAPATTATETAAQPTGTAVAAAKRGEQIPFAGSFFHPGPHSQPFQVSFCFCFISEWRREIG
jgi:hypothetical protein